MSESSIIYDSIVLVVALTLIVLIGIWFFGRYLFGGRYHRLHDSPSYALFVEALRLNRQNQGYEFNRSINALTNYLGEFLEKRNDFWTYYGQIIICIFIVAILAILLLTGKISAEAGLPILSAISGFAIAKGGSGRNKSNDNLPNSNG